MYSLQELMNARPLVRSPKRSLGVAGFAYRGLCTLTECSCCSGYLQRILWFSDAGFEMLESMRAVLSSMSSRMCCIITWRAAIPHSVCAIQSESDVAMVAIR